MRTVDWKTPPIVGRSKPAPGAEVREYLDLLEDRRRAAAGGKPKVVAVIVNYRTPEESLACVRSLRTLNYSNLDILLVENDSKDDSAKIFSAALAKSPADFQRVSLIVAEENGGYTAGNNLGIREAIRRGADFVHVINPDTLVVNRDYLSELVDYLEANPRAGVIGPRVYLGEVGNIQNTILRFPWVTRRCFDWVTRRFAPKKRTQPTTACNVEVLNGVCLLIRAACLREVGVFDDRIFAYIEDVDWSYRAELRGWSRVHLPVDSIVHLQKAQGYERFGGVDYLLKRNTLYFLLKTGHWLQAASYTVSVLGIACGSALIRALRGRPAAPVLNWTQRLARTYGNLWTFQWSKALGRPS